MLSAPSEPSLRRARFARFARFNVVYNLAVILWGAFVRATGSGAGCGMRGQWEGGVYQPEVAVMYGLISDAYGALIP